MTKEDFEKQLIEIASFDNSEDFWELFLYLKLPTQLPPSSKIFIFKNSIKPTWEHQENKNGGRIFVDLSLSHETNVTWQNTVLEFLTGFKNKEEFDEMINGLEITNRNGQIKLCFWTKNTHHKELKQFFYKLKRYVPLPKKSEFDFSSHPTAHKNSEYQKKELQIIHQ